MRFTALLHHVYPLEALRTAYRDLKREAVPGVDGQTWLQAKLSEVKTELRRRMHDPVPEVGKWLHSVVGGHIRYYGVPMNRRALSLFRFQVGRLWHRGLPRRSQNGRVLWDRMRRLMNRWWPPARICHPYPLRRLGVLP